MATPAPQVAFSVSRRSSILRVGTDLCAVEDIAESVRHFGDRYLRRVYTEAELGYCTKAPLQTAERLAARFAAKEATIKVLRPVGGRPDWTTMEVTRHSEGWCELALSGTAARLAAAAGIQELSLSLSHERGFATAVVVALLATSDSSSQEQAQLERGRWTP